MDKKLIHKIIHKNWKIFIHAFLTESRINQTAECKSHTISSLHLINTQSKHICPHFIHESEVLLQLLQEMIPQARRKWSIRRQVNLTKLIKHQRASPLDQASHRGGHTIENPLWNAPYVSLDQVLKTRSFSRPLTQKRLYNQNCIATTHEYKCLHYLRFAPRHESLRDLRLFMPRHLVTE